MTGIQTDAEFEFELIFALPGTDLEEDALFEAGCDDALVGLGTPGTIGLGFRRPGVNVDAVISDTAAAALSALPAGARLR